MLIIMASVLLSLLACVIFNRFVQMGLKKNLNKNAILEKLRSEISLLITELNGTTERNIALVENRIQEMKSLMQEIAKLQKILEMQTHREERMDKVYTDLGRNRPLDIQLESHSSSVSEELNQQETALPEEHSLQEQVLMLYEAGESADRIAEKLNMNRGEVDLFLSLHVRTPHG